MGRRAGPLGGLWRDVVDLHTHILWGIDDGARTLDESIAIGRAASEVGVRVVAATPHIRSGTVELGSLAARVREVNVALQSAGIPLLVVQGGEVDHKRLAILDDVDLQAVSLGGTNYVLVETPYPHDPGGVTFELVLDRAIASGVRVVLAHPERNAKLATNRLLRRLIGEGALVQVTASSLLGEFGKRVRARGFALIGLGLAHILASDAHDAGRRIASLSAVRRQGQATDCPTAVTERLELMVEGIPSLVLAGSDVRGTLPRLSWGVRSRWSRRLPSLLS